ncbi:MAG: TIGR03086 family metal-binding protein [Acidimicrobiia bacterium]
MTTTRNAQPPVPSPQVAGPGDDPRTVLARAVGTAGIVLGQVTTDRLGDPTPCEDFDVRLLANHLVEVLRRVAMVGRGDDPHAFPEPVDGPDPDYDALWLLAVLEVEAAWRDDGMLERTVHLPWTSLPGADALAMYTNEVTVHTWDLATALGRHPVWDPQVLDVAYAAIRQGLPAEGRAEEFAAVRAGMPEEFHDFPDPFAAAVDVPDDAPLIDRLVAWNGRRP